MDASGDVQDRGLEMTTFDKESSSDDVGRREDCSITSSNKFEKCNIA